MKIIFIANSGQKYDAQRYYLSERRIFNGLVRNGHDVWFFGDREELRHASPLGLRGIGRKRVNEKLLRVIHNFQPDAIFMLNANIIEPHILGLIKEKYPHIKIAQIIYDAIFVQSNRQAWMARLPYVDCHFFTTAGPALADFSAQGRPCYFIPNMSDAAIDTGRAFDLENPTHEVTCIIGSSAGRKKKEDMMLAIRRDMPHVRFCYRGFGGEPALRGADYIQTLAQSAMALNLSHDVCEGDISSPETRYLYSSDRLAQIMGNGCLALVEDAYGLEDLYSTDEVAFFFGEDELKEKIERFAADPVTRQKIAQRGWEKAHHDFSTDLVTRYMVERVFEQKPSHDYAWPIAAIIA